MKKKLISLLLVGIMVLGNTTVAFANESHIYEEKISENASGAEALAALENGTGVIIDVRAAKRQENYSIEGSISLPLFTVDANNKNVPINLQDGETDDLEDAFNEYITNNKETLKDKMIYILCNSGATGAKNATTLLVDAGYSLDSIRTIENGAKNLDILNAAISSGEYWENDYQNYVSAEDAVAAIGSETIVTFDVRATERYDAGHLKGSISLPLFSVDENDKNVVTPLDGELATAFTSYVTGNKADLSTKTIYILCNGGQSGARTALKLLLAAGYDFENIWTIKGGATNTSIQEKFVVDTPSTDDSITEEEPTQEKEPVTGDSTTTTTDTVKTGDSTGMMTYIFMMGVALIAIITASKKRFAK